MELFRQKNGTKLNHLFFVAQVKKKLMFGEGDTLVDHTTVNARISARATLKEHFRLYYLTMSHFIKRTV